MNEYQKRSIASYLTNLFSYTYIDRHWIYPTLNQLPYIVQINHILTPPFNLVSILSRDLWAGWGVLSHMFRSKI